MPLSSVMNAGTEQAIRIRLCGELSVRVGDTDATAVLSGRQAKLLLAYLVSVHGEPVRRDDLIDVVWQGRLPQAPEAALSSLLTGVRRAVGPAALSGRSLVTLNLPAGTWIDVDQAREEARLADSALAGGAAADALRRACAGLELIERPALAELHGPWVEHLRATLDELRCDLLETAARAALACDEVVAAQRHARGVLELEPYREAGYGLLMEALARAGNVAEALLTFDRLRVMLREELGVPPAPALTALHERLLAQGAVTVTPAVPTVPLPALIRRYERRSFVGRGRELRRLHQHWERVRDGQSALVLVTGEPGIGKTRLAARFAAEAHAGGAIVLHGRADKDNVFPYQPLAEALRQLAEHVDLPDAELLRPLLPQASAAGEASARENGRHVLFDGAVAALAQVAQAQPLLLVLEDLHWADKPTALLLRHIVRHADAAPVLLLASYSDVDLTPGSPLAHVLADLRHDHVIERIALGGLSAEEVAVLAAGAIDAARLREYTGGNPFFIEETLRSGEGVAVAETVRERLLHRFERCSDAAVDAITLAAVFGTDFGVRELEPATGQPLDDLITSLEEATAAGLVVEDAERVGRLSFCHALMRDAIYARPAASRRRLLHLRAGEALEQLGGAPAALAHHFHLARHAGGAGRAARYAMEAGVEAERAYAFEDAAAHFERALEALDLVPDAGVRERIDAWLALGGVRWKGGEPGARDAYFAAAELARGCGDAEALVAAALGAGGRVYAPGQSDPQYVELVESALAAADAEGGIRARLLGRLAEALPDGAPRSRASDDALRLGRASGDPSTVAVTLLSRHAALLHISGLDDRLELAREAIRLADSAGLRETSALARHWLVFDLVEAGDVAAAQALHEELAAIVGKLRQPLYQHSSLAWGAIWAGLAGRFGEAERLALEGLRLAERAGAPDARANFTAQLLPLRREQGRLGEIEPELRLVGGSGVLAWAAFLPLAQLEAGDASAAARSFEAARRSLPSGLWWLPANAWLAETAARLGRWDACLELLERLEPYAGRIVQAGFTGCWGAVDRYLGLLSAAVGRSEAARRQLDAALRLHQAIGAVALVRRTERDLGGL